MTPSIDTRSAGAEQAESLGASLVVADWGAEVCGDAIRAFWAVDRTTNRIKDARFKTFGCGTAIASSDMMCEMIIGKTVDEAMKITNVDVNYLLSGLWPGNVGRRGLGRVGRVPRLGQCQLPLVLKKRLQTQW